jgi:uncharacterized protein YwqG
MKEDQKVLGFVDVCIEYLNEDKKTLYTMKNTVLKKGREALALSLANEIGERYSYYISQMWFGDGGTISNQPKIVDAERTSLFGSKIAGKPIVSSIDPSVSSQVIFTSVLKYSDAVDSVLNEMALVMNNGDFYSMVTFPDLNKTDQMQITWNWRINFL